MDQHDDRICTNSDRGSMIKLRCKDHPDLVWQTKNISHIGARSIFFDLMHELTVNECPCPASLLYHDCKDDK